MTVAQRARRVAGREVARRLVGEQRGDRVEHRDVDELARCRCALAREQRREIPCTANMPVAMSAMATPSRNGGPSAAPVMLISPPSACIIAS